MIQRLRFVFGVVLLGGASASAQPRVGVVPGASYAGVSGTTICMSREGQLSGGCVFYEVRPFRGRASVQMHVDGLTANLRETGRATTRTAYDREYRVTRTYSVQNYRAVDGSFTAELWTRSDDVEDGGDCGEMRGGVTVRKGGRQTHVRLEGSGCVFG